MSGDFGFSKAKAKTIYNEPGIKEANFTYFSLVVISVLILNLAYLLKNFEVAFAIGAAFLLIVMNIVFVVAAGLKHDSRQNKHFKYYLSFICAAFCLCFSLTAVLNKLQISEFSKYNIYITAGMIGFAVVDLLVLSLGRLERLLMIVMSGAALILLIAGIGCWVADNAAIGAPLTFAALSLFLLHSAMTVYVMSGDSFFETIAGAYFIIIIVGALIALMIASGEGDCSGCDCAPDCSTGGRRAKMKNQMYNNIDIVNKY